MSDSEYYYSNVSSDDDEEETKYTIRTPDLIEKKCLNCKTIIEWDSKKPFCRNYSCPKMYIPVLKSIILNSSK